MRTKIVPASEITAVRGLSASAYLDPEYEIEVSITVQARNVVRGVTKVGAIRETVKFNKEQTLAIMKAKNVDIEGARKLVQDLIKEYACAAMTEATRT